MTLFGALGAGSVRAILQRQRPIALKSGQYAFRQGDAVDGLCVLLPAGVASLPQIVDVVWTNQTTGRTLRLERVRGPALLGHVEVVQSGHLLKHQGPSSKRVGAGRTRLTSVRAVTDIHLVRIPFGTLDLLTAEELIGLAAVLGRHAAEAFAGGLAALHDAFVDDGTYRLAAWLRQETGSFSPAASGGVGQTARTQPLPQEEIATLMIAHARQGARVVRLKGGDPFIFGRGGEELEALRAAGVAATIVPGITAAAGCAAATGIPLTHRGLSQAVTFVTAEAGKGGAPDINWSALAVLRHTVAVYMGVRRAGQVANALIAAGRGGATPVAVIERGTLPEQRIIRTHLSALCAGVAHHEIKGPALLIIGEVAALADDGALREIVAQGGLAA